MFFKLKKEKIIWLGASFFLSVLVIFFSVVPGADAQSQDEERTGYITVLEQVMNFIQNYYVDDVDAKQLYEGAIRGMFESLDDPYSVYLSESDLDDLSDTTTGRFGGVGLYISKDRAEAGFDERHKPYVRVVAPIVGTPAYRLGISAGDYIIRINDKSTENMTIDEVMNRLRGEPGTEVNVTILRGEDITFSVDIVRDNIVVPTVRTGMIKDDIAYLRIIQFTPMTPEDVKKAVEDFTESGFSSMVIDLRGNPGGLLSAVTEIADLFLSGDVIVSTRSKIPSENRVYRAGRRTGLPSDVPVVVLIDRGSASASEILAGALSDNGRAVLVGETTFGKGSVQQVRQIGDGGFKLTMSRYFTPEGTNIDKVGVEPDKIVKEPSLSDEEAESYKKIIENFMIQSFVGENPEPAEEDISRFIRDLREDGMVLDERLIRRLIRNEVNKTNNDPPVFDLEYDLVLQEAVRFLQTGDFSDS